MDMREMVDKVKKGEPLYGVSELSPYMQGVAARNSRYSALMGHVLAWPNFVNHNQVGFYAWRRVSFMICTNADFVIAWRGHGKVLSAGRKRAGSREIKIDMRHALG